MSQHNFIVTTDVIAEIEQILHSVRCDKVFVLVDSNTSKCCYPVLDLSGFSPCLIEIEAGDESKSLEVVQKIWDKFIDNSASRYSILINLGGGVVSDIGGFAASTFKRGMPFINVPTTLLAAVDAATGGKNGINYRGLKNEIGLFAQPQMVIINTQFFNTLSIENLLSGFAEMIKHALISDEAVLSELLAFDVERFAIEDIGNLLARNLMVKQNVVDNDPLERGKRKALNFGHTFGHAFEALSYKKKSPMLHGYAVMWGMVAELYLSAIRLNLNRAVVRDIAYFTKQYYGLFPYTCDDYEEIINLMRHDKKNFGGEINFSLLVAVGDVRVNQVVDRNEIVEALDFIREI